MRAPRPAVLTAAVVLSGLALGGCDAAQEVTGPDPDGTAEALASALTSGDFAGVPLADADPADVGRQWQQVTDGLGEDLAPSVGVISLDEGDGTAAVTYAWSWPVGEQEWAYETDARLELVDDEWQVHWGRALVEPSLRRGEVLDVDRVTPQRGGIVGARGLALVADRDVVRFGIDRSQVPARRAGESARRLAALVDVDPAPFAKQVEAAGDLAFVEAIVLRKEDVPLTVARGYEQIPGARAVTGELPLAPTREFAAPILGSVGQVTAEMIEEDPETYQLGDVAGLSGLQARYDEQLRGAPGLVVQAVGRDDRERELYRVEPTPGEDLRLTLDVDLQLAAERLLAPVAPASALVAIRPSTGDVLAAANGPGNDGYNVATYGQLAPGSTFKSVSTLALLREGLGPDSPVPCTPSLVVDGKRFENYDDYPAGGLGRIPLRTALANSCNTAFISQQPRLPDDALVEAAASLGMGVDHDLGFPAYFGSVVPPASETEAAADMIGQGKVLASPMVMAAVVASVQAGETVLPRLVRDWEVEPADVPPLEPREATALRTMLRGVVTSGSGSLLADVPGPPVIAKTGTAEFDDDGALRTHAWMIAAQGDLAVAVFVELGDSGSGTAGPILEAFLRTAR